MSPAVAKVHVSGLLSKLRARDRARLVVIAYESGVVRPGRATHPVATTGVRVGRRRGGRSTS